MSAARSPWCRGSGSLSVPGSQVPGSQVRPGSSMLAVKGSGCHEVRGSVDPEGPVQSVVCPGASAWGDGPSYSVVTGPMRDRSHGSPGARAPTSRASVSRGLSARSSAFCRDRPDHSSPCTQGSRRHPPIMFSRQSGSRRSGRRPTRQGSLAPGLGKREAGSCSGQPWRTTRGEHANKLS